MAATKPEITKLLTKVNFTDGSRGKGQVAYLVKHFVGATGSAEANCRYFKDAYRGASAHYFVGHDGEIYQCVKDEDIAWHCGAKSYKHKECRNSNSIGVELCVKKDKNGKWYYTDATKQAAVRLFAYLMDKYDIPLDHVLRHYDVTGKTCGEPDVRFGNKVWSTFKKELAAELGTDVSKKTDTAAQEDVAPSVPYRVQTTCDALNIRSGAGAGYPVVGSIQETVGRKKAYTIVEEKNGWGKLKSGAGWISLAYTKKAG